MNKKFIVGIMFALFLVIPLGAVALHPTSSVTPGSKTTVFGIPVTQSFTGLQTSTAYEIRCPGTAAASNTTWSFTSDSSGEATVTVTPPAYGQNTFSVHEVGYAESCAFTVENMDIMPYIIILITISILFSVLKMFTGKGGGLF